MPSPTLLSVYRLVCITLTPQFTVFDLRAQFRTVLISGIETPDRVDYFLLHKADALLDVGFRPTPR